MVLLVYIPSSPGKNFLAKAHVLFFVVQSRRVSTSLQSALMDLASVSGILRLKTKKGYTGIFESSGER